MSKWSGIIGFSTPEEVRPGVWKDKIVKKSYFGDVIEDNRRWDQGFDTNDDLTVSNQISIVADSFAHDNIYNMKFIEFMGGFWKVSNVRIQSPRLLIRVGGLWNGKTD